MSHLRQQVPKKREYLCVYFISIFIYLKILLFSGRGAAQKSKILSLKEKRRVNEK
jgi:hypothetical protein